MDSLTRDEGTPASRYAAVAEHRRLPGWIPRLVAAVMVGVLLTLLKLAVLNSGSSAATSSPPAGQVQPQFEPTPQDTYFDQTPCTLGVAPSLNAKTTLTFGEATQVTTQLQSVIAEGLHYKRLDCYAEVWGAGSDSYNFYAAQSPLPLYHSTMVEIDFSKAAVAPSSSAIYDGREFNYTFNDYDVGKTHTVYVKLIKRDGRWKFAYTSSQPQG
jgi:hypothetical protein